MSEGLLAGTRVIELGGIGPVPFAGMLLADMGAEVIRIDAVATAGAQPRFPVLERGKKSMTVDLKSDEGREIVLRLVASSDGVLEGFRPGVLERRGLGPHDCLERNPELVFARVTGWGQDGPLAQAPGHDINFLALSGVLHTIGTAEEPTIPLNLIADFGAGGAMTAFGFVAALVKAKRTGAGSVLDVSMVDGSALMLAMTYGFLARGAWKDERHVNVLDGGAPFYGVYACADGKHVAIGAIEPEFFTALVRALGVEHEPAFARQHDASTWPAMRARFASIFLTRTRDEWARDLEASEACLTPVLSLAEAPTHAHNVARGTFRTDGLLISPQPVPRVNDCDTSPTHAAASGIDTMSLLGSLGFDEEAIRDLRGRGVVG
jgi:alpha-methylacyl-CoA racemase